MKSFILLCMFIATLLSGCSNSEPAHVNEQPSPPQIESVDIKDSQIWQPTLESLDIEQVLHLQDNQSYDVFDFQDNLALILTSDPSKRNPSDINDQVTTMFYESFFLLDTSSKTVIKEYPIQKFGICTSALSAFNGIVFSFFEISPDQTLDSSICYINTSGIQQIYEGSFSPFGMGPVLQHYDNSILFSYLDREGASFGVVKITETFEADTILHFRTEDVDYISDDFKASKNSYGYTIGESGKVTFCVGTNSGTTNRISLPEGRKIHGFDVTGDTLIVSLAADEMDLNKPAGILTYDLITGEPILELEDRSPPLYSISANEYEQMCGFSQSTLKFYTLREQVEKITTNTSTVSGEFYKILSNDNDFLVVTYGFETPPKVWLIHSNNSKLVNNLGTK